MKIYDFLTYKRKKYIPETRLKTWNRKGSNISANNQSV